MSFSTMELKVQETVATLTIARPEALNALSVQVLKELEQALDQVLEQKARVLILKGAGDKAFVAGADIKEIQALSKEGAYEFARQGQRVFRKLESLPLATIAQVQGFALGGGLELALSTDMILASTKAQFGLPESTLGLIPGFGGTVRLSRRIGSQRAKAVALMGNIFSAEKAYELGIISELVEPEALEETAQKWAKTLASRAPLALAGIKKSMDGYGHLSVEEALEKEAEVFQSLFDSEDVKEGLSAFVEKRKPAFTGR